MNNIGTSIDHKQETPPESNSQQRKPYHKPRLVELGDMRALTFGSYPGFTDSGGLGNVNPF